jgi:thioredoxin-dependent peroxiredoxin
VVAEGDPAPDFTLPDQDGRATTLSTLRGRRVILYFYPEDDTPGCTRQACDLRDHAAAFDARGATVLGISPDDVPSHRAFADRFGLPFTLLADPELTVAKRYGVWREKQLFGRKYLGIERTTFVIDADGRVEHVLRRVRPATHADRLLKLL